MSRLVRNGDPSDVPAMVALDALCFTEGVRYDEETFTLWLLHPNAISLVIEEDREGIPFFVGFVLGTSDGGRGALAHLITLDVHPDFRRQGIGSNLLKMLEKAVVKKGLKKMVLEVYTENLDALSLYQAHGYRILALLPEYYGQEQNGYLMLKEL